MRFDNKFRKIQIGEQKLKILILEDQNVCIGGCEGFEYLGVKIDTEDRI